MNEIILDRLSNLSHTGAAEALALERHEEGQGDQEKSLGCTAHEAGEAYMQALNDPKGEYVTPWEKLHKDDQGAMEAAAQAVAARVREECAAILDGMALKGESSAISAAYSLAACAIRKGERSGPALSVGGARNNDAAKSTS